MSVDSSSYSHKIRIRVCGLLVEEDSILLAQIHSPVTQNLVWMPPGGGLQFGETMRTCLTREFKEETNLQIEVRNLIHVNELVSSPFHALEFYFEVKQIGGTLQLGSDPELPAEEQLLKDLKWTPVSRLVDIEFAPQNLLPKIQDWSDRSAFRIFSAK